MYLGPAASRCPSHVPPGSASRWNWLWWKARRRAAGGASRWNVITIWDAVSLLMVIILLAGDLLGMSLATDNVRPSPMPMAGESAD